MRTRLTICRQPLYTTQRSWKSRLNCDYLDLRDGERMNTSVLRISIGARVCSALKRLVNTGTVFILTRILLQFAIHSITICSILFWVAHEWVFVVHLPGQEGLHSTLCVAGPGHVWPPLIGTGFVHVLVLFCTPLPQRALHSDHPDQDDHPPFTENESGREKKRIHRRN